MNIKKFSILEALKFGFGATLNNFGFFLGILIMMGGILIISVPFIFLVDFSVIWPLLRGVTAMIHDPEAISALKHSISGRIGISLGIGLLIFIIIKSFLLLGFYKIALNLYDKKEVSVETLFCCLNMVFRYIIASLIYSAIVFVGLILFIAPGIYFKFKFGFYKEFIVDQNTGILESLKLSSNASYGNKWNLFAMSVAFSSFYLLAPTTFGILLLILSPAYTLAEVYAYKKLR